MFVIISIIIKEYEKDKILYQSNSKDILFDKLSKINNLNNEYKNEYKLIGNIYEIDSDTCNIIDFINVITTYI